MANIINSNINFKIFVDFDGTITSKDVGEEIFLHFGNAERSYEIAKDWMDFKINSMQSLVMLCANIPRLNLDEFDGFIDEFDIDETFPEFLRYCRRNNMDVLVLSDGLDYYISRIFNNYNLYNLKFYSNGVKFGENNAPVPYFPYTDEECTRCANCKRNHVINNSSDEDITIYVGDGLSDTCPAQHCDFIFAKHSLLKYCEKNRISYYPFKNFYDVIKILDRLRKKKRIRKRHSAELKRREVYLQG